MAESKGKRKPAAKKAAAKSTGTKNTVKKTATRTAAKKSAVVKAVATKKEAAPVEEKKAVAVVEKTVEKAAEAPKKEAAPAIQKAAEEKTAVAPADTAPAKQSVKPAVKETANKGKTTPAAAKAEPAVKAEEKKQIKAEPAKTAPAKKPVAKKAEPAKEEVKAEPAKKAAPVKEEAKAEPAKKAAPVKEEAKAEPAKKAASVKEEVKAEPAKKADVKKEETKPAEEKVVVVETLVEEPKMSKEEEEKLLGEKLKHYNSFDLDTVIKMAQAMGLDKAYDDYKSILLQEDDFEKIAMDLITEANLKRDSFNFDEDGFDIDLIPVLIERVASTMDFKASDFKEFKDKISKDMKLELTDDGMANADVYNALFDDVKKILMFGQQKNIRSAEDLSKMVGSDVKGLITKFMDIAYNLLPYWQYNDVKYYEGFINGVLSQFDDIRPELDNRAMMDVADLYIKKGDYGLGDADYNYVIRENNLKDYIYYRFAKVYQNIDNNKAKDIARGALRYVDDRYTYYPEIIKILEN